MRIKKKTIRFCDSVSFDLNSDRPGPTQIFSNKSQIVIQWNLEYRFVSRKSLLLTFDYPSISIILRVLLLLNRYPYLPLFINS